MKRRLERENDVKMRMRVESLEDDEQWDGTIGEFSDLFDEDSDDLIGELDDSLDDR